MAHNRGQRLHEMGLCAKFVATEGKKVNRLLFNRECRRGTMKDTDTVPSGSISAVAHGRIPSVS